MGLQEFKCPNCGGAIQFDAGAQELVCGYCDSIINIEALKAMDEALAEEQPSEAIDWGYEETEWLGEDQQGMVIYSCRSCGGEIIGDETLGATSCPFCSNPVVMTSKFSGSLKPDLVLPFKKKKEDAIEALNKHYVGKRLLPKVFKDKNHLDEVKGVYIPFWLFNADADVDLAFRATNVRTWSDSSYDYTETSFYRVMREGGIGFNKVPVDGSEATDDTLMESIEPFQMEEAVDFQTAYLAGYFANKYDMGVDDCAERANERIINSAQKAFASTVRGYDSVETERASVRLRSGVVDYALLPVWLLSTSWNDQSFTFAMNGQTGKFVGDLPMDKGSFRKWFAGLFFGSAALLMTISLLIIGRL